MKKALLVKGNAGFYEGAEEDSPLYVGNVTRDRGFLEPIILDDDETVEGAIEALNNGDRKLLKTKVTVEVNGVEVKHSKLSKR